ncbi:pyridoxamine 5'-phosphate oxidase family protein [Kiloniella sp. b19]|uniref:pyridoxamine 5'-phosphate oxidase family protein n=1 Tax=Kiloniella sp. GXU_MW_B19 TaxID=3141326 RepID=UPI0031D1424E
MTRITNHAELSQHYKPARGRSVEKQLEQLEHHSRSFIAHSPFVLLATHGADRLGDVSPRGDLPGFVHIENDHSLLLPDWPGNNRIDSLRNIIDNPGVGLLFLIPGVNETLRINGQASIHTDGELLALFDRNGKKPLSVLRIAVREVFLHCAKALMRSELWDSNRQIVRSDFPTMGQMITDQIAGKTTVSRPSDQENPSSPNTQEAPESQEAMEARYRKLLY